MRWRPHSDPGTRRRHWQSSSRATREETAVRGEKPPHRRPHTWRERARTHEARAHESSSSPQTGVSLRCCGPRPIDDDDRYYTRTETVCTAAAVMCRALRRQQSKMSPPKNDNNNSYADRLDTLKRVFKPYRDNHANCLRLITKSARVNLNKHWKSLENLFTAGHDHCKERAQNTANERLENAENACGRSSTTVDPTSDTVDRLRRLHVDR